MSENVFCLREISYLSMGYQETISPQPICNVAIDSSVLQGAFVVGYKENSGHVRVHFLLAGITVPGVIVHLLCISVILPSRDDRYIFYKVIHSCM